MSKKTSDALVSTPKARSENLLVQNSENELLVYDLKTNRAICLNETSALIWKQCDGTKTIEEITTNIESSIGKKVSEDLVWFAVDQLREENLLETANEIPARFGDLSRREVIRKIGIGSMIALPIVSGIVAPNSIHAQSCVGMGANFAPGTVTASGGTYPGGTCIPGDPSNICAGQGGNCCTGVASLTCHPVGAGPVPGAAPFSCDCT